MVERSPIVSVSALSADFLRLEEDIKDIESIPGVRMHHMDIMDGHFVNNLSFGFPVLKAVKKIATLPLDVHLMIETEPSYIFRFAEAGADLLSFHVEAYPDCSTILENLKDRFSGIKLGLSFNPETPIASIEPWLEKLDFVNLMSVHPGFGGQAFIPESIQKVRDLKTLLEKKGVDNKVLIEVDGGVNGDNAVDLIQAGANILVSGSYIYKKSTTSERKKAVESLIGSVE